MKQISLAWVSLCALVLSTAGCATVTKGTTQPVAISSQPDGAECTLTRSGQPLGKVTTPGSVTVKRDASPINILCTKSGYEAARAIMNARTESATYGNIILGGAIGSMIDASSGANNRYEATLTVELTPLSAADQAAQAATGKEPPAPVSSNPADSNPAPGALTSPLGATYRDTVTVGSSMFPLLEGEWTLVAASKGRMYLAQMEGNRLARWIYLSTNIEWKPGGWGRNNDICDRKGVAAGYSDKIYNSNNVECWILDHRGMAMGDDPSQVAIDFYRWSDGRGRPNTAVALSYFFVKNGDFFRADYYFNPVVAGFPDTPTAAWQGNPWHIDVASKDTKKLAYLRQLKATGETLLDKLKLVLR